MKILICSRAFKPSVGGLEMMMEVLADEFVDAGHAVKVLTQTRDRRSHKDSTREKIERYEIIRSPSLACFVRAARWSNVCLSANVSLRDLGPILIARRPLVISHQGIYESRDINSQIKRLVTRFTGNVCASKAIQKEIPGPSVVIPNTYRNDIFKLFPDVEKDLDIIFVGRLVSDKGVSSLIDSLARLRDINFCPRLSIVGDGPERARILQQIEKLELHSQVELTGLKSGSELAMFIARHRVMAVPSLWAEPFGIVALEGMACGCIVVGTNRGGLPEAIGQGGIVVPNGDSVAMGQAIKQLLQDDSLRTEYRSRAPAHLARHAQTRVARAYLDVLKSVAVK
jgi:glycogen(starch) synthase